MTSVRNLSLQEQAQLVLSLTDLTTLTDTDTVAGVQELCAKATSELGNSAAVCIYPQFIPTVKQATQGTPVTCATVVNFPASTASLEETVKLTQESIAMGVDEVDLVFPFASYLKDVATYGQPDAQNVGVENVEQFAAPHFEYVKTIADLCHATNVKLKVIIESGVLVAPQFIQQASEISIKAGADFIKTSTGKTTVSATLPAAQVMLKTIVATGSQCGFKASGGIRTVAEAVEFLALAEEICGRDFLVPAKFRFGASGIFNDIKSILTTGQPLAQASKAAY